jgi:chromatin remodeling complex protein RSC6
MSYLITADNYIDNNEEPIVHIIDPNDPDDPYNYSSEELNEEEQYQKPIGFRKPCNISVSLANLLQMDHTTKTCIVEINKKLLSYIRTNNLVNRQLRIIVPDTNMLEVIGPARFPISPHNADIGYSFINLQQYLKNHIQF